MFFSKLSVRLLKDVHVSYATTSLESRRKKQNTIAPVRCSCVNMFAMNT